MNLILSLRPQNLLVAIRLVLEKYLEEKGRVVEGICGGIFKLRKER
jgi:hypothetical protein